MPLFHISCSSKATRLLMSRERIAAGMQLLISYARIISVYIQCLQMFKHFLGDEKGQLWRFFEKMFLIFFILIFPLLKLSKKCAW